MPLAGRWLSIGWALALGYHVGFRDKRLTEAVAVMTAESGRYVGAWHDNIDLDSGAVTSTDRGLYQINDRWHPDLLNEDAYQAIPNAEYAFDMSNGGRNWIPWMAYINGAHKQFYDAIREVRARGHWENKIERVETELGGGG